MKSRNHLNPVGRVPGVATSSLQTKLDGTTMILDSVLLAARRAPWKAFDFSGTAGNDTTDTTTTTTG